MVNVTVHGAGPGRPATLGDGWDAWDDTVHQRAFYASARWVSVAAETLSGPAWYLLYRPAGQAGLVASVPCYEIGEDSPFRLCRASTILRRVLTASGPGQGNNDRADGELPDLLMPSLFVGGRNPGHTRLGTRSCPPEQAEAASNELIGAAESIAAERGLASVSVLYVDEDDHLLRKVLKQRGYAGFQHGEAAWLDVPGGSFTDYTANLSRKRRETVNADLRDLRLGGVTYQDVPLADAPAGALVALMGNLSAKYGAGFQAQSTRQQLDVIGRHFGPDATAVLALVGGQLCGSVVTLRWRDSLSLKFTGFDYQVKGTVPVYFGLLFYHLIEYAQANSVTRIFYSTGSGPTKRSRGCTLTGQYAYLKLRDRRAQARLLKKVNHSESNSSG